MKTTEQMDKVLREIDRQAEKSKVAIKQAIAQSDIEIKRILVDFAGEYRDLMRHIDFTEI
tara:strand:- start:3586 stop:3765 length:180 start_codon:yes stop_codon:yes gene_type:complete